MEVEKKKGVHLFDHVRLNGWIQYFEVASTLTRSTVFLAMQTDCMYPPQVTSRPQVKEQENEGVPDTVAAERSWKTHKMLNESIIVELFQVRMEMMITFTATTTATTITETTISQQQ